MTLEQIDIFLKVQPKLKITHDEVSLLAKKNPNDAVNKFKLKFINSMLQQANQILGKSYKPFEEFETFSEDDIPTNSDIVFILSPYLRSLEKMRCDNIDNDGMGSWYWMAEGKMSKLQTDRPTIR